LAGNCIFLAEPDVVADKEHPSPDNEAGDAEDEEKKDLLEHSGKHRISN
jgi:hypothetical protein